MMTLPLSPSLLLAFWPSHLFYYQVLLSLGINRQAPVTLGIFMNVNG